MTEETPEETMPMGLDIEGLEEQFREASPEEMLFAKALAQLDDLDRVIAVIRYMLCDSHRMVLAMGLIAPKPNQACTNPSHVHTGDDHVH